MADALGGGVLPGVAGEAGGEALAQASRGPRAGSRGAQAGPHPVLVWGHLLCARGELLGRSPSADRAVAGRVAWGRLLKWRVAACARV